MNETNSKQTSKTNKAETNKQTVVSFKGKNGKKIKPFFVKMLKSKGENKYFFKRQTPIKLINLLKKEFKMAHVETAVYKILKIKNE